MPDIRIHRHHQLGFARARELSRQWALEAARMYDLTCAVDAGSALDKVAFKRAGVAGQLVVSATHFELTAKLGLLLGALRRSIEAEIGKHLDALLARESRSQVAAEQ